MSKPKLTKSCRAEEEEEKIIFHCYYQKQNMFLGRVRTCACQSYWSQFFVCLLCLLLFHCQAVSPQAALFLMGHATAVFFHYISFNRYADLICCTVTISGAFDKIDTIQKVVQIKVYCLE